MVDVLVAFVIGNPWYEFPLLGYTLIETLNLYSAVSQIKATERVKSQEDQMKTNKFAALFRMH